MSSERRIRASQSNGALSKGPKTSSGRRQSAKNKIRHGILAQTIVLDDEDQSAFLEMLAAFEAEYNPQTKSDSVLVEHLAAATWRLMRIWAIEKAGLVLEMKKHDPAAHDAPTRTAMAFRTLSDDSTSLELLHRYETRYDRQYARAYKLLNSRPSNLPREPNPNNEQSPQNSAHSDFSPTNPHPRQSHSSHPTSPLSTPPTTLKPEIPSPHQQNSPPLQPHATTPCPIGEVSK